MKKTLIVAAFASVAAFTTMPASANDIEQICIEALGADGRPTDGCACLGEAAAGNAEIDANLREVATMPAEERGAHMTEATAAAVGACGIVPVE